ncbi:MAG TPA: lysophospholipid acyltransferase family protein [Gammaproteobacteria bacterium]|nr:lysophospholipid acyltransferase family protein [Gammaproteobacteria bacterium]
MKKTYSRLNLLIRSSLYSFIMIVSSAFHCVLCIMAAPLPLKYRYRLTRLWMVAMIWLGRVLCHMNYRVEGRHNLLKIKNGILFSKHQSAWETIFLAASFDQAAVIVKRELLWLPFFGWGLALLRPIAINRKQSRVAMQQIMTQGKSYLDEGRWVLIFPEGTRVAPGQVGKYRVGGARLAIESGYPLIPIAHNAGHCWSRRQFIKQPGLIRVVYGPPIYPEGKTAEEMLEVAKSWIESTMQELEGAV